MLHDLFRDALRHRMQVERPAEFSALLARAAERETDLVRRQGLLLAEDVMGAGGAGQPVQQHHQRRLGVVRAVPVQVDKVAIGQPQSLTRALQGDGCAQKRRPEGLQMGAG